MVRTARWIVISIAALAVIGITGVSSACDKAQASSADAKVGCTQAVSATVDAGAGGCSAKMAGNAGACAAKMAQAHADCEACKFMAELKANMSKVNVSTVSSKEGITLVFAAVTLDDVPMAKEAATHAYSLMSAPAQCAYTRANMTKNCCAGCKDGFASIADASVTLEETDNGAETVVVTKNADQIEKLQAFVSSFKIRDEAGE